MYDILQQFASSFLGFVVVLSLIWLLVAFFWTPFSLLFYRERRTRLANRINEFYD